MTTKVPTRDVLQREPELPADIGAQLEAFLADPIGYGTFDLNDPISLADFVTARHHRTFFIAPLAF